MSDGAQRRWALVTAGVCIAATRWVLRARSPDGFDSIDFLLAMSRGLDLEKLQPHFPGYPVYIGLGAGLCRLGLSPVNAAAAVSCLAAGAAAVALGRLGERLAGPAAGWAVLTLEGVAFLPWLLGGAALSDSLGLALIALAFALCSGGTPRPAWSGAAVGLLLGTRLSYWPLAVAWGVLAWRELATRKARLVCAAGLAAAVVIWAVPFFASVGMGPFLRLGAQHLAGHFGSWGGSLATRTDVAARGVAFARDVFYDGFAPEPWAVVGAAVVAAGAVFWARRKGVLGLAPGGVRCVLFVLAPYAVWAFVAQNVVEQPRHVLPLVAGGLLLLGCVLSRVRPALALVALAALGANLPLLWQRHATPAAPAQAAEWIAARAPPEDTAIMAGRSWRYFNELPGPYAVREHGWLSEVVVDLSRFDRFPTNVFLTSEVDLHSGGGPSSPLPARWRVEEGPRFCRDARIDRADPCLGLVRLRWEP